MNGSSFIPVRFFKNFLSSDTDFSIYLRFFPSNSEWELNLNSLKTLKSDAQKKSKSGEIPPIQIDNFELKIGTVIYNKYFAALGYVVYDIQYGLHRESGGFDILKALSPEQVL